MAKRGTTSRLKMGSKKQKLSTTSCTDFPEDDDDNGFDCYEEEGKENSDLISDHHYPFKILTTEQIVQYMSDCIKEANTVLQLPATVVRILLHHFHWDKNNLLEAYYDSDQEKLFKDARIIDPTTVQSRNGFNTASDTNEDETCEICYASKPTNMMNEMQCGHRFCAECWDMYLSSKIKDEGVGQTIACAAHDCPILVDDAAVMTLLSDNSVKLRYQHLITSSFVQCHKLLRWCPGADCPNAVQVLYKDCKPVKCTCGYKFCFDCGHNWHEPVKCPMVRRWLKKCDEDLATSKWIATKTKECPKCHATIEKDGGCNHVVCKNQSCNAAFCWVCRKFWNTHNGREAYQCNRYEEQKVAVGDPEENVRAIQRRFVFYSDRYMNHLRSFELEKKLYESIKEKIKEMSERHVRLPDVQFLNRAVDILCRCRQTLAYTYMIAFYLKKTNQSEIFEDNQRDLESSTEQLSEYLEREIDVDNVADMMVKVEDKSRYCESRRKVLVEHVFEGYEKDWWEYNNY